MLEALTRDLDDAIDLHATLSGAQMAHLNRCHLRAGGLVCHVCDDLIESQDAAWIAWIGARGRLYRYVTHLDPPREHAEDRD